MPDTDTPRIPPRIQAALDFLSHTRSITQPYDVSIPTRPLTSLENSVETAALRTLQSYFLCEQDFGDLPPTPRPRADDDPEAPARVPVC